MVHQSKFYTPEVKNLEEEECWRQKKEKKTGQKWNEKGEGKKTADRDAIQKCLGVK